MEQASLQQAKEHIDRAERVLIALPQHPSTDAVCSGVALLSYLRAHNKTATIVAAGYTAPAHHAFVPLAQEIQATPPNGKNFVIAVNIQRTQLEKFSYDVEGDTLKVFITPKSGQLTPADVSMPPSIAFDLVITLDAPNREALGSLFDEHAELFYATPTLNIDHHAANTNFGQVNVVDATATATAEVLYRLLQTLHTDAISSEIATGLLAGIIAKTRSFQTLSVTPQALHLASELVALGAQRDVIIRHLYQTKSLALLRLWGRALATLQGYHHNALLITTLSEEDLRGSDDPVDDLAALMDELLLETPDADVLAVLYPHKGTQHALVHVGSAGAPTERVWAAFHPERVHEHYVLTFATLDVAVAAQQLRESFSALKAQ